MSFSRNPQNDSYDSDDDRKPPAVVVTPQKGLKKQKNDEESVDTMSTASPRDRSEEPAGEILHLEEKLSPSTMARPASSQTLSTLETHASTVVPTSIVSARAQVHSEAVILGATAAVSAASFVYVILPTAALVALATLFSSLYILGSSTFRRLVQVELRRLRESTGLQGIIPARLYSLLTEESLHDQLNTGEGDTTAHDYMYLLLYFLPLPREQLYYYLNRLNPQHVQQLHHPGVGHVLLSPEAMQLVMGEQGYEEATNQVETQQRLLTDGNTSSELARSIPITNGAEVGLVRDRGVVPTNSNDDDNEDEYDDSIMLNALWDSINLSFVLPISSFTSEFLANSVMLPLSRRVAQFSSGVSLVSAGVGLGGFYARNQGRVSWTEFRRTGMSRRQDQALYWTAAVSGASAFFAMGLRYYLQGRKKQQDDAAAAAAPPNAKKAKKRS